VVHAITLGMPTKVAPIPGDDIPEDQL
jgi:hypothetical protein